MRSYSDFCFNTQTKQCARTNIGIFKFGRFIRFDHNCLCLFRVLYEMKCWVWWVGMEAGKNETLWVVSNGDFKFLAEDELTSLNILYTFHLKLLVISVLP